MSNSGVIDYLVDMKGTVITQKLINHLRSKFEGHAVERQHSWWNGYECRECGTTEVTAPESYGTECPQCGWTNAQQTEFNKNGIWV